MPNSRASHLFYGIPDVVLVKAEGLDIWGNDAAEILEQAKHNIPMILNGERKPECR